MTESSLNHREHDPMSTANTPRVDYAAMSTMGAIPSYHARRRPTAVAMQFEGRTTDWRTLDRHARQIANALIAAGFRVRTVRGEQRVTCAARVKDGAVGRALIAGRS